MNNENIKRKTREEIEKISQELYETYIASHQFFQENFTHLSMGIRWKYEEYRRYKFIKFFGREILYLWPPWIPSEKKIKEQLRQNGENPHEWYLIVGAQKPLPSKDILPEEFKGIKVFFEVRGPAQLY